MPRPDTAERVRRASETSPSNLAAVLSEAGFNGFCASRERKRIPFTFRIFLARTLFPALRDWCLSVVEANMKRMYMNSAIGWDKDEKARELSQDESRFMVAFCEDRVAQAAEVSDDNRQRFLAAAAWALGQEPVAFVMFQFSTEEYSEGDMAVLYCYEIQVVEGLRGIGLGTHMMRMLQVLARHWRMEKVMLTVFKENAPAREFYTSKLGFAMDENSPSAYLSNDKADKYDYEILSKPV